MKQTLLPIFPTPSLNRTGKLDGFAFSADIGGPSIHLLQGDCLELMQDIPDGSVDMICSDPPYGTTNCRWDSIIPLEPMWSHLKRVIKPNGAIVLTASQPFTTTLISSNMGMFKYCWVWEKTKPSDHLNAKNKPLKSHEDVVVFSSGTTANRSKKRMVYNPQGLVYQPGRKQRNATISSKKGGVIGFRPSHVPSYNFEYVNYPRSILKIANPNNKTIHPTQKPVALMEYLIKTYTNEGETVLDFCMGSGTTGKACKNLNRNFIGIEKDPEYFKIAKDRLDQAT